MKNRQDSRLAGGSRKPLAHAWRALAAAALLVAGLLEPAGAATSNITATKHNLSKTGPGTVKSSTETQICAFCHTPHGANITAPVPLWNRNNDNTYSKTTYKSLSLDASDKDGEGYLPPPAGSSLLCLSCHDGTVALGQVNVLRGTSTKIPVDNAASAGITDASVGATTVKDGMPGGTGATTGFTRLLGTNLGNDHPISVTYNNNLATADGELRALDGGQRYPAGEPAVGTPSVIGLRSSRVHPLLPLLPTAGDGSGQVQCATCHDPHITNEKFLRLKRLQGPGAPSSGFDPDNDIICLACHEKGGAEWANSVHARSDIATYTYAADAATLREFPASTPVWKAACLNCHDTHTVAGARRLLREGVEAGSTTGYSARSGGKSAIEETCYQCHNKPTPTSGPANVLNSLAALTASSGVPDIKSAFALARRMPITRAEQGGVTDEVHDITNADFVEAPTQLGSTSTSNRHVECTDCHNPHRVRKNSLFNDLGSSSQRTHTAGGTAANLGADGNVASGVLRGMWGLEPTYGSLATRWPDNTTTYAMRKGIPGASTARSESWLTREYQLCFKCHSDYSNPTAFPSLGRTGGTPSTTNGMTVYTNVAAEFAVKATDPPTAGTDQGEIGITTNATGDIDPSGSFPGDAMTGTTTMSDPDTTVTTNHRSWHPVHFPTGRTLAERRIDSATTYNFRTPFKTYVGTQTMHCSDCHGMATATESSWTQNTGPDLTKVQGPHGSDKNFLLKGDWSTSANIGSPLFCGNCHNPTAGSSGTGNTATNRTSGFNNPGDAGGGGHGNEHSGRPCMRCHVAVPHGWKNKAFLVNLNCVGEEVGKTTCNPTSSYANYPGDSGTDERTYSAAPYYNASFLRVKTWRPSGNWTATSCGASGAKNSGTSWMDQGGVC